MRCPNCQSTDIVAIQGQSYCINCGQLVAEPKPSSARKTVASLVKVGISVPAPAAEPKPEEQKPEKAKEPIKIEHKIKPVKTEEPKKVSNDIAPAKKAEHQVLDLKSEAPKEKAPAGPVPAAKIQPHPWHTSAGLAAMVAVPAALVVAGALYLRVDNDILAFILIPALILMVAATTTLAQAALMYGLAKRHDGRSVNKKGWWRMAGQSAAELLQLNVLVLAAVVLLAAAGYSAWRYSGGLLDQLPIVRIAVLALTNIVLIWGLAALLVARRLAGAAIVINDIPLFTAIRLGLGMYWKIGGHLLAATAESLAIKTLSLVVLAGLALGAFYISGSAPSALMPVVFAGAVLTGVFIILTLSLHVEVRLWLSQYRHWAPLCFPDQRKTMLAKPRSLKPKLG